MSQAANSLMGSPEVPDPLLCPDIPAPCPVDLLPYLLCILSDKPMMGSQPAQRDECCMDAHPASLPTLALATLVGRMGRCLGFPRVAPKPHLPLPAPHPAYPQAKSWQYGTHHFVCMELERQNMEMLLLDAMFSVPLPWGDPRALISSLYQGKPQWK